MAGNHASTGYADKKVADQIKVVSSASSHMEVDPASEAKLQAKDQDEEQYPTGLAFGMILMSLYSSLFLVALVSSRS